MAQPHDLYFFIRLPPWIAHRAARLLQELALPRCSWRGDAMPGERLHITVEKLGRFLGHIPNHVLDQAIAAGCNLTAQPFGIHLDLVQGIRGRDGKGMAQLKGRGAGLRGVCDFERSLAQAMRRQGCLETQIRRSFDPHVTLHYSHESFDRRIITPLAWQVTEFMLVDSLYGLGKHEVLGCWPLVSRQQGFDW